MDEAYVFRNILGTCNILFASICFICSLSFVHRYIDIVFAKKTLVSAASLHNKFFMSFILPLEVFPLSNLCAGFLPENDHFTNLFANKKRTNEHKMSHRITLNYNQTSKIFLAIIELFLWVTSYFCYKGNQGAQAVVTKIVWCLNFLQTMCIVLEFELIYNLCKLICWVIELRRDIVQ